MNPLVGAGIGILGSLFGGGNRTPGYVKQNYKLQNSVLKRAIDLYDNTDLNAQDAAALAAYSHTVMSQAATALGNNEARYAAAGSPHSKQDTKKDRQQAQVSSDAANQIGQLQANLDTTRAARQAALLPNAAQAAAGTQAAQYLDQQQYAENDANMQGITAVGNLVSALLPKKSAKKPNGVTINSVF